ncbi:MAG TPA: TetR/AcrR family transcriptional regulator [Acidimicrobiales bacterium]|nr:TetR/AcrR family transcriptional regulator [Acidimicrobiales bacterium]
MAAADRRAQLLEAARTIFAASGPDGARIRDIAEAAGVNEALIYRHFSSKDELFAAAVLEPVNLVVERLRREATSLPVGSDELGAEYVLGFFRELLTVLTESISLLGVVLFADREAGRDFYDRQFAPFLDAAADIVRSNLASWDHLDFDPAVVTPMFVGMCWGLAIDASFRGTELDVEACARLMTQVVFRGLGGGAGTEPRSSAASET